MLHNFTRAPLCLVPCTNTHYTLLIFVVLWDREGEHVWLNNSETIFLLFELSLTNCKEHNKKGGLQKAKIEVGTLLKVTDLSI